MFRFADTKDKVLMITGVLAAIAVGISMPAFTLLWGQMTDTFQTSESDPDAMVRESKKIMFNLIYIGIGVFVCGWAMAASWIISG
jgi:ATP-binding cassette subfamily B (MDR/TAP) protein 1